MDLSAREDAELVVAVTGELDVCETASVVAGLMAVSVPGRAVIIDLAGLEYIDSSGLAALALVRRDTRRAGGDLLLAGPQRQVLRVLTITRLVDVFSVHACVADAVASTQRSAAATRLALLPAS
jgi:anti-sigma B factor antagonist